MDITGIDIAACGTMIGTIITSVVATALVRNATGKNVSISRFDDSSNIMNLIVRNGEILMYVYDGSKWVHSW